MGKNRLSIFEIIAVVFLLCVTVQHSAAQSFTWPVATHPVGQPYAAYDNGSANKYHTGMDIGDGNYNYTTTVMAAHAGTVHKIFGIYNLPSSTNLRRWNPSTGTYSWDAQPTTDRLSQPYGTDNKGLGICVIIYHSDLQLYTLYGHMDAVVAGLAPGQTISAGAVIGKMGNSYEQFLRRSPTAVGTPPTPQGSPPPGYSWSSLITADSSGFGPHIHFEAKERGVLSTGRTDEGGPELGWGYIAASAPGAIEKPGHPNFYGYHDPNIFLTQTVTKLAQPLSIELSASVYIRDFPSTDSSLSLIISQVTSRGDGKLPAFAATRSVGGGEWYQVFLPNATSEGWSAAGWIAGNLSGTIYSRENNTLNQIKVNLDSAYLYASPSTASSILAVTHGQTCSLSQCGALIEGQQFVSFESTSGWYHVFTPQKASQADGWILASAVTYIPGATTSYAIMATKTGSGTVSSNPAGISCGSDCSESYTSGTSVTLTATPDSGWSFGGWGGECSGTGSCTVSMTSAKSVSATFATKAAPSPSYTPATMSARTLCDDPVWNRKMFLYINNYYFPTIKLYTDVLQAQLFGFDQSITMYENFITLGESFVAMGKTIGEKQAQDILGGAIKSASNAMKLNYTKFGDNAFLIAKEITDGVAEINKFYTNPADFAAALTIKLGTTFINALDLWVITDLTSKINSWNSISNSLFSFYHSCGSIDNMSDLSDSDRAIVVDMKLGIESSFNDLAVANNPGPLLSSGQSNLLPAPILSSSLIGVPTSTTPTFSWDQVAGANEYWLMVATNQSDLPTDTTSTGCPKCIISGSTTQHSYTPPNPFSNIGKANILKPNTTYYWQVMAFNDTSAGNYSVQQAVTTLAAVSDTVAPPAPTGITVAPAGWTNGSLFYIDWINPSDESGISKVWWKLGYPPTSRSDGTVQDLPSFKPLPISVASEGTNVVYVWLEDGSSNTDFRNSASVVFKYDVTPPTIAITSPTVSSTYTAQASPIVLSGNAADNSNGSGISSIIWADDHGNSGGVTVSPNSYNWTSSAINLVQGANAITVWAIDNAGNFSTSKITINYSPNQQPVETGLLNITLSPAGAVSTGAQWRVDSGNYRNNGDTATGLTPGPHTVSFKTVAGYTTPADKTVTITSGATTSDSATYTPIVATTYALNTNSDHGLVYRNPNKSTFSPGETVRLSTNNNAGWHFDYWSGDVPGTTTASAIDVVMDRDKTVTANWASGDASLVTITMTLTPPEAIAAGARWRIDGGTWQYSDQPLTGQFLGDHYIEFADAPGWFRPAAFNGDFVRGATNLTGAYTQDATAGTLIVTLTPSDAVTAGAKWRVGGSGPQNNAAPLSLPPGNYTVSFDMASGWTTPASQPVTIQAGQTMLASGNYIPATGQPVIGSIRPSLGSVVGGTLVTIDGANFNPPVSVTIDAKAASNVTVVSSTRVTFRTPPQPTYKKTVPVSVQAAGGTTTSSNGFTYGAVRGTDLKLHTELGGAVLTAAIKGNYAFIGQGSRLVVLNIMNPSSPAPVEPELLFAGLVNNIKIVGNYLYIANAEEGLQVVNIANPEQPVLVGTFNTPATAQAVAVLGGRAYIAAKEAGLQIVDVSDPANLRLVGSVSTDGWASDVSVNVSAQGVFAYVANLFGTLKVLNVTDPASASVVGSLSIDANLYSAVYAANRVYVGTLEQCVIVGVDNNTNLTTLGTFSNGAGQGIAYSSGYIFTVGNAGLRIVDVATPGSPNEVGTLPGFSAGPFAQIAVVGTTALVSAGTDGLRIIDVSNRTVPTQRGQYLDLAGAGTGYAGGLALANNTLYAASGKSLEILDVLDSLAPVPRSPFSPAGQAQAVRVFGNRAYILEGNAVQIVDISNPQSVGLLGTIQPSMTVIGDIAVSGSLGYLTSSAMADGGRPTLRVLDLTKPSAPTERSSLELASQYDSGYGIVLRGNFAYIILKNAGAMRIVDVSNPGLPQLRGVLTGLGSPNSVALSADGTHALVACDAALKILDVRDSSNPRLVASYSQGAYSTEVVGDLAYVAAGSKGVVVLDIKDRANPMLVRSYDTPGSARGIAVNGSALYVADGYGGLLILTIPDTESPKAFITNPVFPGLSPVYPSPTSTLSLGGGASDIVGVTRVTWTNSRGGGGEADGTDNWFVAGIALQPGTNELTVTAYDAAGNSGSDTLTVTYQPPKQSQSITFPAIADQTFGDAPFVLAAGASSGLPVNFSIVSGPASLSNNVLTLLGVGVVAVQANQPGDDFFNPALPIDVSFTVAKADQGISFTQLPDKLVNDAPFAVNATASSGLPVTFSIVSGPATVSSNVVTLTGGGAVVVRASQSGNANFNPAADVQISFIVDKVLQFISFGALSGQMFGDAPFALSATASSGLPVNFSLVSGPAGLSGDILSITGMGSIVVKASQAGNANYSAAADVQQTIAVSAKAITITANNASRAYGAVNPATPGFSAPGLISGDAISGVTYTYATTATSTAGVGTTHAITPGGAVFSNGSAANYAITYVDGTLTIAALLGDLDGNGPVDLADCILAFQVMTGIQPRVSLHLENGIGKNNKIGMGDIVYILQKTAGIR